MPVEDNLSNDTQPTDKTEPIRRAAVRKVHGAKPSSVLRVLRVARHRLLPDPPRAIAGKLDGVRRMVLFVGYPASGHTLLGSILNSHPHAVISNELDALFYFQHGVRGRKLLNAILRKDMKFEREGRRNTKGYTYQVGKQSLKSKPSLEIIGDKKGFPTARRLARRPELLPQLGASLNLPVTVVHVVRNPFDIVGSFSKIAKSPMDAAFQLEEMARLVSEARSGVADENWHTVRFEDLFDAPTETLESLFAVLGLEPGPEFVDTVRESLFESPPRPSARLTWTTELKDRVFTLAEYDKALCRYMVEPT